MSLNQFKYWKLKLIKKKNIYVTRLSKWKLNKLLRVSPELQMHKKL